MDLYVKAVIESSFGFSDFLGWHAVTLSLTTEL